MPIFEQNNRELFGLPRLGRDLRRGGLSGARPVVVVSSGGAPTYTLLYNSDTTGGSTVNSSNGNFTYYAGHTLYNDSGNKIGRISVRLTAVGTITGKTFVAKIWTTNGGQDCVSTVATSDDVTGSNAWSDTLVDFTFSTPFTNSAATNYNITFAEKSGTADSSNYITVSYQSIAGAISPAPGNLGYSWWGPNSGSPGQFGTFQPTLIACMKVYTVSP